MNHTQQAWEEKKVAGALLLDVKSAFSNVSEAHLGRRMEAPEIEPAPCRTQMKLVLDGKTGEVSPVDTSIPQGSPAAPILFVTYLSGIFDEVESALPGIRGLSFADDIGWWADEADDEAVAAKLSEAAAASADRAASNGVAPSHGKTEAAIFRRKKTPPATAVKVGTNTVPFNKEATRWLGIRLDSQHALKDHHAIRLRTGRRWWQGFVGLQDGWGCRLSTAGWL